MLLWATNSVANEVSSFNPTNFDNDGLLDVDSAGQLPSAEKGGPMSQWNLHGRSTVTAVSKVVLILRALRNSVTEYTREARLAGVGEGGVNNASF